MAKTQGTHHIGLTVPDLQQTRTFFLSVLGFEQLGEVPDYPAVFLSDGEIMITLWQVSDPQSFTAFDRRNVVGLHHFALRVADAAALEDLHQTLKSSVGVSIEFSPEPLGGGPTQHMMVNIPGGIRVEFIAAG